MKKISKALAMFFATVLCVSNIALAATEVPKKVDPDEPERTTAAAKKDDDDDDSSKASASAKASEKSKASASAKASEKSKASESAKASEKSKASASAKASEKSKASASAKASAKATKSASSKKDEDEEETKNDNEKVVLDITDEDEALVIETTEEPSINIQGSTSQLENDKYLTDVGAFFWFLFGVIVSAVVSFGISYRFYMMLKRDNHINAEIRALKRDVDSKMVGTVTGFSEYDINMTNSNPSYAKESSPIRTTQNYEADEKTEEIYKKWENQLNTTKEPTPAPRPVERPVARPAADTGRPSYERRRPVSKKKDKGIAGKIKGVFNDMFPFEK